MDDFLEEMRPTLEDIESSNSISRSPDSTSTSILETYFPSMD